jgi:Zn finger protein HypA/HybF involved in hydrogenase expression
MRKRATKEEQVAKRLAMTVSDVTLDLDEIGRHLATEPTVLANRLDIIIEATRYEKEEIHDRHYFD